MERPAHRFSFGGARDAETGEDAGMSPASPAGVPGSPQQPEYNPKSKRRQGLARRAAAAVKEAGAAKIISGAISIFLLLSVFSAIAGTNSGLERPKKVSIHLRARELLPIATPKVPTVKVDSSKFVQRKGLRLVLNGQTFKFAGASNYYMLTRAVEKVTKPQVSEVFETAQKLGITVVRVWAFNDGDTWNALQPRMGHIDERVLTDGLDWVVNEAREFGIRIIMVLTDSQGDYGGMAQYVRWAGPLTETVRDFYASKRIRKAFKEYVGAVILHKNAATGVYYRDDPTILGWEIANAPVCPGDDTGDLLQNWIEDLSGHVKSLDQNHLVLLGHSGVFGASTPDKWQYNPMALDVTTPVYPQAHAYDAVCEGADWVRNHEAPYVDIASVQVWPDDWMQAPEPWKLHWSRQWLRAHADVSGWLKKPIIVSAFSKQRRTGQSDMATRNAFYEMVYQEAERSDVIAGTLFWLLASNSYPDYDGYTVYTSKVAVQQPAPAWPQLSPELVDAGLARRRFLNWDAMLVCGAKRAMGNNTANKPINPYKPDANAWLDGWADVLDVINSHSQAMAKLAGVKLSKAALSHVQVPRPRYDSPLLPDTAVQALPQIPDDFRITAESDEDSQQQQQQQPDSKSTGTGQQLDSQQQSGAGDSQGQERAASAGTRKQGAGTQAEAAAVGRSAEEGEDTAAEDGDSVSGAQIPANATALAAVSKEANDEKQQGSMVHASDSSGNSSSSGGSGSGGGSVFNETEPNEDSPDGHIGQAPRLDATEAANIDFDDVDADATHGSGFLARLSDSVTGALGSVFSSRASTDEELDAIELSTDDGTNESDRLVAAGADRVVDEGSEHAADAALAVDETDDATGAGAAANRATDATEQADGQDSEPKPGGAAVGKADGSLPMVAAENGDDTGGAPLLTAEEAELGVMHAAEDGAADTQEEQ